MAVPFPSTAQLTDFGGAAENPLSEGGAWEQSVFGRPPMLKGVFSASDSVHGPPNFSTYVKTSYSSDGIVEVWACTTGGQLGAALEDWRVTMFLEPHYDAYGYSVLYGGGIAKVWGLRRYDGDIATPTSLQQAGGFGYPGVMGMRIVGDDLEVWGSYGGVWTNIFTYTEAPPVYRGNFQIGIAIEDETAGGLNFTCFGGGVKNRTQIYRLVRGQ